MNEGDCFYRRGISGNTLKGIAVLSMFLDHIGAVLVENGILVSVSGPERGMWQMTDLALRTVGRIAFPIFCFLLVEGFLHTRDIQRYLKRLLLFAFVSEIPFDLAIYGKWYAPDHQNVFFTLFLGLLALFCFRSFLGQPMKQALALLAAGGAALLLNCDYDITGIVMILCMYLFYENKRMQTVLGVLLAAMESLVCFGAGALAFVPIRMYNGTRGRENFKYLFYVFYPFHLLVLYFVYKAIAV